jgi:hypothetical protein
MTRNPPQTCTVIIRMWLEPREGAGEAEWRGEIKHVATGRTIYFRHLHSLPGKLRQFLDIESTPT